MAAPLGPLSDPGAEKSLLEINQDLQSQLEKSKQDFRDLKEKFLISEATAYSLANQLQKYKCEESSDIIESVLGEKGQLEKRERADTLAEKLRQCHLLIKDQTEELTRLYDKLREGRDVCQLLDKHLEDLLSHDDPEHCQGQGFQEQLAEGRRLAKCLARKLSSENYEKEEDEHEEETRTPSVEQEEVEKKEVLQDRVDDCDLTPSVLEEGCDSDQSYSDENQIDQEGPKGQESVAPRLSGQLLEVVEQVGSRDSPDNHNLTHSVLPELSDSYRPYRSAAIFSPEDLEVCSSLEVAKNQIDQEGPKGQESVAPRLSGQLLEVVEQVGSRDSPDNHNLTHSVLPELSDSYRPYRSAAIFSPEDLEVCSSLEVAKNQIDQEGPKGQESVAPRLSGQLLEVVEQVGSRDSPDNHNLTHSVLPELSDSYRPYRSAAIFSPEDLEVCSSLEVAKNQIDQEGPKGQESVAPRLSGQLLEVVEQVGSRDSPDNHNLTHSVLPELSDSYRPYRSAAIFSPEDLEVCSSLEVAKNQIDQEGPKGQESVAPRLSGQLLEVVEQVGSRDSPDNHNLTYSVLPELSDSYRPYRSAAIFSPEDLEVCSSLEVAKNQIDQEGPKGQESVAPRLSGQLLEVVEQVGSRDSPDNHNLTHSVLPELSDSYRPYRSAAIFSPEDLEVCSSLEVAKNQIDQEGPKGQESVAPRLSGQLLEVVEQVGSRDSPDKHYLTYSVLPDLSDSYWPYRSAAIFSPEDLEVCSSLEVAKNQISHKEEEDQDPIGPRLTAELPEVEEDTPCDYLDECYLTYSALPDLSDSLGTCRKADITSFEDLDICSALEVANSHNDLVEEEDQGRIYASPDCHTRLHRELPVTEENEDPQDSLDDCYLTSSFGHDPPDTCRPYTSASFTFDKQEPFLGLDVDAPMQAPHHQGPSSGNVSFQMAKVQMSGAQTQPSTQVANSLRQRLEQQLDCGDNRARLGLSSAFGSLDAKMGSGNQWPLFQELGLDASLYVKNPPKLEGDAAEASRDSQCECQVFGHRKALGVMEEKIPKRKLQFGRWRLACRFRGPLA
ncbi:neuroblastoma breakpoint family member 4-like isoform X2 [Ursus americanus]|uniref:neuroblastoma breakpoint family member 4-like isoform X2 n=1 Tax=Ursus americanus TaxID=9643 RepID=UPI001E679700|nr:neuroblastoma breakpoint family member 4-like isoform X2 [Ursus americanus]